MRRALAAAALCALGGCAPQRGTLDVAQALAAESGGALRPVSAVERREYLRRARIFDPVDVAARDLMVGPPDRHAFGFRERVSCDFIEPRADHVPVGGTTPKFFCRLRHQRRPVDVKIKYGRDNREIYGELLGSRLLWALGVAVDRDYPVRVRCHDCPVEPWNAYRDYARPDASPRATRLIDDAVLQRLYPGAPIEECLRLDGERCAQARSDQGWSFAELDLIDPAVGGAPRAEVDALRLLAAFIAHGDDKPSNQRLICPFGAVDDAGSCRAPRLLVADLGSTFGRGASRVLGIIDREARPSFAAWSSLPMWQDAASCRAYLVARDSASHPQVHEAGRRLLAERLSSLTERQLRDLFIIARVEEMGETVAGAGGQSRPVTVDDWVAAFRRRRAAIVDHRCPE